jgi:hypothetical protein
MGGGG